MSKKEKEFLKTDIYLKKEKNISIKIVQKCNNVIM